VNSRNKVGNIDEEINDYMLTYGRKKGREEMRACYSLGNQIEKKQKIQRCGAASFFLRLLLRLKIFILIRLLLLPFDI
jgi:hypothetical protein